ncbi:MAG: nicotinamide riboside transporter PnuC [Bacteroidota bacterium]|nr:nicotinamide riboside transporter PnuC [Bacteroidota bacterium]MDP4214228.1 nicotinamide riboside transporter PnuC [Bacteroidota bacterium]MDP4248853.1 nicotinamide riboside transporter PnuC [Bacteroidota bacterium]
MQQIVQQFLSDIHQTTWIEFIAVITGIASVIYSRRENILVYPVGMVSTGIFIYLYLKHGLYADASVNFYYTVMSIVGWYMWSGKAGSSPSRHPSSVIRHPKKGAALKITVSTSKEWRDTLIFFFVCWAVLYLVLKHFTDSTVPVADSFTSGAAFTGMWLMNKKKLENWTWWVITNLASIPLNFYKHLVFTSFQYVVFLILAIMGYITWRKKILHAGA